MNFYQVDIVVADDPEANESLVLDEDEVISRYPWAKYLMRYDPDTFRADVVVGLTNIKIKPTDWEDVEVADLEIEELASLCAIEDVVEQFDGFKLRRVEGAEWWGCVSHDSFVVDHKRQKYLWHSRRQFGGVVEFLQEAVGLSREETLRWLKDYLTRETNNAH